MFFVAGRVRRMWSPTKNCWTVIKREWTQHGAGSESWSYGSKYEEENYWFIIKIVHGGNESINGNLCGIFFSRHFLLRKSRELQSSFFFCALCCGDEKRVANAGIIFFFFGNSRSRETLINFKLLSFLSPRLVSFRQSFRLSAISFLRATIFFIVSGKFFFLLHVAFIRYLT